VHAEAGGGVDLADPAADLAVGAGDVGGDEVDAGDVEADRAGGADRHLAVVGVDDVGEVDGGAAGAEVAGAAQVHELAGGEHGVRGVALELEEAAGLVVELDAGEDLLVADAAARVALTSSTSWAMVRSPSPTTWPGTRLAHGDQLAVDDQEAVVEALEEGLDDDGVGVLWAFSKAARDGLGGGEVDGDAAAVVGVEGLDDDGVAEALGGDGRPRGVADHLLARHGEAEVAEDPVGLLLVGGDLDGDVAGLGGDGGAWIRFW
jgi:hypothetical protein